jgi:hypothetical protein
MDVKFAGCRAIAFFTNQPASRASAASRRRRRGNAKIFSGYFLCCFCDSTVNLDYFSHIFSKLQFQPELNLARTACRGDRSETRHSHIEAPVRLAEVNIIEGIEEFGAELQVYPLA